MPDVYIAETASEKRKAKSEKRLEPVHNLPGHTHNPLASYCYMPDRVRFETQDKEERIILFLRQHIITNIPWILIAIILALAPLLLPVFPLLSFLPPKFQVVAIIGWYLVTTAFILENFLAWFFNVYIVTDERIVDVDFHNLIYKEISDAKIDKIQDMTYNVGGTVRTVFNYGDVLIQTAGTIPNFDFVAVPNPAEVARILQKLRIEEEQEVLEGRVR